MTTGSFEKLWHTLGHLEGYVHEGVFVSMPWVAEDVGGEEALTAYGARLEAPSKQKGRAKAVL